MKKVLFFFVLLVAMVCTMTTLTSCGDEQEDGAIVSVISSIDMLESQVTTETLDDAKATKARIDARLVKMFGKEFVVACKQGEMPKAEDVLDQSVRIRDDKEINKEVDHLRTLETISGNAAVYNVDFCFVNGDLLYTTYRMPL